MQFLGLDHIFHSTWQNDAKNSISPRNVETSALGLNFQIRWISSWHGQKSGSNGWLGDSWFWIH